MAERKYAVRYKGKVMSLAEFSNMVDVPYSTLESRAKTKSDLCAPKKETRPRKSIAAGGGYENGYTFNELAALYKCFAGQSDELRMVMDFTGLCKSEAAEVLQSLRENAKNKRKGYCA